jgi:hypothetical protein
MLLLSVASATMAQQPSAIVEEVRADDAAVEAFEYLWPEQLIHLGDGGILVLGYFQSCSRETITGGKVTIGIGGSQVSGGLVVREIVECDGGSADLSEEQASSSGVAVFRAGDDERPLLIYSLTPAFTFSQGVAELVVRRLDRKEPPLVVPVTSPAVDFAALGKTLKGGGTYEIRAGADKQVIKVAVYARPSGPLVGRLVGF